MATGANIKSKDTYVYFLYSEQQYKERTELDRKMSMTFSPGTVVVNGRKKIFTEMSRNSKNRYPDCKVVAEGFKGKLTFTPVSTK